MSSAGLAWSVLPQVALAKARVLVIHSYHAELAWTNQSKVGIDQGFQESDLEIQIFHEFLDLKRYPLAEHKAIFWDMLRQKYTKADIDLVMVGDDPGLGIVLENRASFLPSIPIIFFGINNVRPDLLEGENITGVFETHSALETILEGVRQTESEGVIFISDSSATGIAARHSVEPLANSPGAPEEIIHIVDLIATDIAEVIEQYPPHWPVYPLGQFRETSVDGPLMDAGPGVKLLAQTVSNPIYSTGLDDFGNGIVGGKMLSGTFHTRKAVELAEMILRGQSAKAIQPVVKSQSQWLFDARQLKQHGIAHDVLPAGSQILYQEDSWWATNQKWLRVMIITIVSSSGIIIVLTLLIRRQHETSEQLLAKQKQLEIARKTLEQRVEARTYELAKTKEKAEAANDAKSNFLASMSHELRTPLNAILGFSQLMGRDNTLDGKQKSTISIINRSGEHLLMLINDILEMSKIEAGQITMNAANFDLHALLQSLREMLVPKAKAKGIQLQFNYSKNLPQYIHTDESKLRQVLINLLGNAIKFTQQGQVSLTAEVSELPEQLRFVVADTGPGIAETDLCHLFKPFYQTTVGRRHRTGTGLGLALSKSFVELMSGELMVQSQLGEGSRFMFTIRASSVPSMASLGEVAAMPRVMGLAPEQPIPKLLVVDDHPDNQQLLVQLLSSVGFQVKTADDGQAAIALCNAWHPDLVWMDIGMPVMDGITATRHLKAQATSPCIIALTAHTFQQEREKALAAGCDDFVRKPFREQDIWDKLAQHLDVTYVYEILPDCSDNSPPQAILSNQEESSKDGEDAFQQQLALMPDDWKQELFHAASCLRSEKVLTILEDLPPQQTDLKQAISKMVQDFRYDQILGLLDMASAPIL